MTNTSTAPRDLRRPPLEAGRLFTYIAAFAGLMAVLFAVAGLIGVICALAVPQVGDLISSSGLKTQASYDLAALLVGSSLWLVFWRLAQQRVARAPEERDAVERRLFLAAVFAVTSVVVLFALQTVLRVALTYAGTPDQNSALRDGVMAGAQLLTYGLAWLAYARLGWREHSPRAADFAHDIAVSVLTGFALVCLFNGLQEGLRQLVLTIQGSSDHTVMGVSYISAGTAWGAIASWLLAGGVVWGFISRYDWLRGGRRLMRVLYLYLVLLVAVPVALVNGTQLLYELVRRALGYEDLSAAGNWAFLPDVVSFLVAAAAIWAYHWWLIRQQNRVAGLPAVVKAAIAWPRRPAIAALDIIGLAMVSVAVISLLWLAIDALLTTHGAVDGGYWWRDQLSTSLAAGGIGTLLWLPAWTILQRAARADPQRERTAWERESLLEILMFGSALVAAGFTVALFYQVWRGILGATDANTLSDALRYLGTAVLAATVAAYHGILWRRDRQYRVPQPPQLRVAALITPGSEHTLAALEQGSGRQIELTGYLAPDIMGSMSDLAILQEQLAALGKDGLVDRALLILRSDGGLLYPYRSPGFHPRSRIGIEQPEAKVLSAVGGSDTA